MNYILLEVFLNRIVLALCAVLLCSSFLFAQTNTTSLSGVVTDPMGAVVPGVSVSISNAASGSAQRTQTKAKGEFSFEQIPPGTYEVKLVAAGFSQLVERVQLLVSTPLSLAFKLTVGTNEVVNVERNLAELNTTDGTLGKASGLHRSSTSRPELRSHTQQAITRLQFAAVFPSRTTTLALV